MFRYEIREARGIDSIVRCEVPDPEPGPGQVVVEMRAWSLNYRDLAMPGGGYPGNDKVKRNPPLVPLSDGAGVVVAVGAGVQNLSIGDRVASCFFQEWADGELTERAQASALGGAIDGVLAERVVLSAQGCTRLPDWLTDAQAATLPCAAVTAWSALREAGLRPGQTVLVLGTGGVSLFALQIACASGARVIATSSSNEKLERARALGADAGVNYRECSDWDREVLRLTDGVGVDHVIEVGGAGTLERSLRAARVSGTVSLIGVLTGPGEQPPSPMAALFRRITLRGIYVGSRRHQQELIEALGVAHRAAARTGSEWAPVIDRTFDAGDVAQVRAAYRHLKSGQHFGKVVLSRG